MKFVMTQAVCPEGMQLLDGIADVYVADNQDPNNYLDEMKDADALIVRIAKCDANAIENSPKLKVIGRTGVGYDSVDVKKATELGIPVLLVNPESQELLTEMIELVSTATNTQERANELLSYMASQKTMLSDKLADVEPESVYLAGNSSLLSTAGPAMYQSSMIELAGGKNAAEEITDTYWAEISYEQLLAWDPAYIILASDADYTVDDILNDENLKDCTAVKNGQVYQIPGDVEALDSPVPASILASVWLAGILHPEQVPADTYTTESNTYYETFYGILSLIHI